MERLTVAAALAVLVAVSGVAAAQGNAPPEAAAGLDQTVVEETTVYLDAGGSHDPDGRVTTYDWDITAPNGGSVAPDCRSCEQTQFTPMTPGEYEVNLTVTDDDGANHSDVLYVTAEAAEGPSVNVTGPTETEAGSVETYEVEMEAGDGGLRNVTMYQNSTPMGNWSLDTRSTTVEYVHVFNESGTADLHAVVKDTYGNASEDAITINVTGTVDSSVSAQGGLAGSNCDGTYVSFGLDGQECHNPDEDGQRSDVLMGDTVFLNNGEEGLQRRVSGVNLTLEEWQTEMLAKEDEDAVNITKTNRQLQESVESHDIEASSVVSDPDISNNDNSGRNRELGNYGGGDTVRSPDRTTDSLTDSTGSVESDSIGNSRSSNAGSGYTGSGVRFADRY